MAMKGKATYGNMWKMMKMKSFFRVSEAEMEHLWWVKYDVAGNAFVDKLQDMTFLNRFRMTRQRLTPVVLQQ
jgi:hypothetical protein